MLLNVMRSSANVIKQNTNQIESVIGSIDVLINDIGYEWEGATYSSFVDNYRRISPSISSFVKMLEDLQNNLVTASNKMEEADKAEATKGNSSTSPHEIWSCYHR